MDSKSCQREGSGKILLPAMIPFTRKKTHPSIIISEEKIQVLLLDQTGKRVTHLAEERLDPSVIVAGEVKNSGKLAQSLANLFQVAKIDQREVVVGIPENKCYTKVLSLPRLKLDELAEAINWEAETYLPVPTDQAYMDWKIISEVQKKQVGILLIAVPKEIIDGYTQAIKQANFTPVAFETTALSLIRLIEKQENHTLVLELEREHAVLALTKDKTIEASSVVSLAGEEEGKGLPYLIQTIQKMLSFYETKHKDEEKVQAIYICGEGVTDAVLSEIKKGVGREVRPCPVLLENLPKGKEQNFAVVSSVAMTQIEAPRNEYTINLLPPAIQEQFDRLKSQKVNKFLLITSLVVSAIATSASLAALIYLGTLQQSLLTKQQKLTALSPETGKVVGDTEQLNRAADTIVNVGGKRTFPQARLATLLSSAPQGVKLVSVILDENQEKLRLVGKAQTRADMLKFRNDLEATGIYSEASLPLSSLQQSENIDFILNATINK